MYECKICGTDSLETKWKSRNRCLKCNRVIKRKNKVNNFSFENPVDRTMLRNTFPWSALKTEKEFNELKYLYLDAFDSIISSYKDIESKMRKDVDAAEIKFFLRFDLRDLFTIKRRARVPDRFYQYAGRFRKMNSNERNAVYRAFVWIWEELTTRTCLYIDREKEKELIERYLKLAE